MVIAPEQMPGHNAPIEHDPFASLFGQTTDVFSGLGLDAPEGFGRPPDDFSRRLPGDMYPENQDEYDRILSWCKASQIAAFAAREAEEAKWMRFYAHYRSFVKKEPGNWHSTVFVPICFWVIETITPRLVAQLPKFAVNPMTMDDVDSAENMEVLLDHAVRESNLYGELVKAMKSALKYGTAILKTFHRQDIRKGRKHQRQMAPVMRPMQVPVVDEMGQPWINMNGEPEFEMRDTEVGYLDLGMQSQVYTYTAYDGPAAECIDIFNFWPAPEAHDVQSARYVIHRVYKPLSYIKRRVKEGVYHWPSNLTESELTNTTDDPTLKRLESIDRGYGGDDPTNKVVELLEYWLDDGRVITMANRKALLRVQQNPFDHSEKPFIRIVDYLQEHEFWGVGEIEPIEGLQDIHNALVNSRIDNLRLVINAMFYVNTNHVVDVKDFTMRPGGLVRGTGDWKPEEVFQRIDIGDVTSSAFTETELLERTVEKVTGVTGMQMGMDVPSQTDTATGLAMLSEAGNSRFGMKSKLMELMGIVPLGRQYASLLQQFTTEERQVRLGMVDPETQEPMFASFGPESIQGGLDVSIGSESLMQSDTMKQEQRMNLLGLMAQFWPNGVEAAVDEVLDSFGIKDKQKFLYGGPMTQMQQQQEQMMMDQMAQQDPSMMGGAPAELPIPGQEAPFGEQNAAQMQQGIEQQFATGAQV